MSYATCIIIVIFIYACIDKKRITRRTTILHFAKNYKMYALSMTTVVFLLWIPSFLAVYPGLFIYDIQAQYVQVALNNYNEYQPILHTLFSAGLVWVGQVISGSINFGVALSCIAQLLIFSIIIGYWYGVMYRYEVPLYVRVITLLIVDFYPPVVINMMALNKDNFFALFLVSSVIMNYRMFMEEDFWDNRNNVLLWITFTVGMLSFRNNAIYALLLFVPLWIYSVWKNRKIRKRAIVLLTVSFVIYLIVKFPITRAITMQGVGEQEKLSIPCQQLVRVYNNCYDDLSGDEKEYIEGLFTDRMALDYYCPYMADVTKHYLDTDKLKTDKKAFWKNYFILMARFPKEYLDAFLHTNYGLWYMYPNLTLVWDGTPGYAFLENRYPATTESKLPILLDFFKLFENSSLVQGGEVVFVFLYASTVLLFMYSVFVLGYFGTKRYDYWS